ncbi:hypothetical protein CUBM_gp76c [Staphylococcus phage CUB-M]|nr:MAG: hypothetical protein [Staphylococcus phage RP2]UPO38621.1 hypothetical protein [Staphylococcus phage vB_SaS_GE1]UWV19980.1 hypothetical protein [Staphylococcus phage APTC_SA_2]UWV20146.1 hypothetical protein [Staphylococcus phage APTC_SA_4]UWV20564.1 hypothetical protein [Staphylococcus phage APTC_SA_13]WPH67235.1 hypothetical protein CUBM_gp76c [Staphylococcus phage CUB-M]
MFISIFPTLLIIIIYLILFITLYQNIIIYNRSTPYFLNTYFFSCNP